MYQSGLNGGVNTPNPRRCFCTTGEISGSAVDFGGGIYYNTRMFI